jgi:hypothetical protein
MSRQPFLPTYKDSPVMYGVEMVERLPQLASLVGRCAANWTMVESQMALTMGSLLGVENAASVAVFTSLRNSRAQREAIEAAAKVSLTVDLQDIFSALLNVHKSLDSQRNDVIHGVWGNSEAIPDAAIWISLQNYAVSHIAIYHREGKIQGDEHSYLMTKDLFVWPYQDIESLIRDIISIGRAIGNFHAHLRYRDNSAGAYALQALCAEPLIKLEIDRLNRLVQEPL